MKDINAVIVETQEISLQKGDWWLAVVRRARPLVKHSAVIHNL